MHKNSIVLQKSFTNLVFLVIDKTTEITPQQSVDRAQLSIPNSIELADPYFDQPSNVDMLNAHRCGHLF